MTKLTEMFAENTNETATTNNRSLAGTAQLTSLANSIVAEVMKKADADAENYQEKIVASQTDNNAMDELIRELYDLSSTDVEFLKALDEEVQNSMLKSQQSKRSRSKSKTMTLENYRSLMSGAVAELLLRQAMGKPKSSLGYRRASGSIEYTAEELENFKNDQEALRREIRNVQSKKSIMKSKADFNEENERWIKLLEVEDQLKSLRVGGTRVKTVVVDTTKEKLLEELGDKEVDSLKSADMKELLKKLLSGAEEPTEEPTEI
ncbi:MAG: hypothetical protein GX938_10345 [Spirochaetales bacterium]|nr:hypothetical protein [Spirochaetales bacterium]